MDTEGYNILSENIMSNKNFYVFQVFRKILIQDNFVQLWMKQTKRWLTHFTWIIEPWREIVWKNCIKPIIVSILKIYGP